MNRTEPIIIESTGGLRLSGVLHHPDAAAGDLGVVVAHGMLSSKDSAKHRAICEAVSSRGATALRFDFRGRGFSEGDPSILTVSNEIKDMRAVVAEIRVRCARVAMVGSSLGGTIALLTAAQDTGIAGLATIAAPARLPDGPREAWGGSGRTRRDGLVEVAPGELIDGEFFRDATLHEPTSAVRSIECSWLVVHGAADPVVPVEDAHLLLEHAPHAVSLIHPTAAHRFDGPRELEWLVSVIADFVCRA